MSSRVVTLILMAVCLPRLARAQTAPGTTEATAEPAPTQPPPATTEPAAPPVQPSPAPPAAQPPTPTVPPAAAPARPAQPTQSPPRLPQVPAPPPTLTTPPVSPAPTTFTRTDYFGTQIVGIDLAALLGSAALASVSGSPLALFVYFAAAPAVHALHEDGVGAAESFLIHLTLPVVGVYVGAEIEQGHCSGDLCGLGGAILGGIVGIASATAFDAIFLAHNTTTVTMARAPRIRTAPALALTPQGTVLFGLRARL